jgi:hypothetical protein
MAFPNPDIGGAVNCVRCVGPEGAVTETRGVYVRPPALPESRPVIVRAADGVRRPQPHCRRRGLTDASVDFDAEAVQFAVQR